MNPESAIANYTFYFMLFTAVLAVVAIIQIWFVWRADKTAAKTAQSAKDSANIANQALIASQRAWIRIDQIGLGGGGLAIHDNGASVSISFAITNIGNSPALNVTPYAWLIVLRSGISPLEEQQRRCMEVRSQPFGLGFTLFPNESFPGNIGFGSWSLGTNANRAEIEDGAASGGHLLLFIVGCIDYTFPTDVTNHHQTRFIFEVQRNEPLPIALENSIIPITNLKLMETAIGGGRFAD